MKRLCHIGLCLTASLFVARAAMADPKDAPRLVFLATYNTGLGVEGAENHQHTSHWHGIAALTNVAGSVDVLDLSNPFQPQLLYRLEIDTAAGTPNSVAVHQ